MEAEYRQNTPDPEYQSLAGVKIDIFITLVENQRYQAENPKVAEKSKNFGPCAVAAF